MGKKPEYDVSNIIEIDKTMFIIEKNKEQIYLIARPSDYSYVAIHYESEKICLIIIKIGSYGLRMEKRTRKINIWKDFKTYRNQ